MSVALSLTKIRLHHRFSILVIASILCAGVSMMLPNAAVAVPHSSCSETKEMSNHLPEAVARAVLQHASQQSGLPISKLRIVESQQRNWSDGCLGLAEPGILCTQAIVEGWRVVVSHNEQTRVYRTDSQGTQVRLETLETEPAEN